MQEDINLFDQSRNRKIPISIYWPDKKKSSKIPMVVFSAGYQNQEDIKSNKLSNHLQYSFLAKFFNNKGFVFISIQHEILGDNDGLEFIEKKLIQYEARKHLYIRGVENIKFVLEDLKNKYIQKLDFKNIIFSGHSNGGDITKFFASKNKELISKIILFDARRCFIDPELRNKNVKILMFEADDTSTDIGVLPDEGTEKSPKRIGFEWLIYKPLDAFHISYKDKNITEKLKNKIYNIINFFLI